MFESDFSFNYVGGNRFGLGPGSLGFKHMQDVRKRTQEKWAGLGFLDGLQGHIRENIAQLYESQATHLLSVTTHDGNLWDLREAIFKVLW